MKTSLRIAVGTDHRGFSHKKQLLVSQKLGKFSISFIDCGAADATRSDYPRFAQAVCELILNKKADRGILLCGTGAGMAIAANRHPGIYAAVAWNATVAQMAREDDGCNVLVIPADFMTAEEMEDAISAWLNARFKEGIYADRLAQIDQKIR